MNKQGEKPEPVLAKSRVSVVEKFSPTVEARMDQLIEGIEYSILDLGVCQFRVWVKGNNPLPPEHGTIKLLVESFARGRAGRTGFKPEERFALMGVESSKTQRLEYNRERGVLRVVYKQGGSYVYELVPQAIWDEAIRITLDGQSVGKWLASTIEGRFKYEREK
jgi:hypothetical protein